jgi:hypothetical protein
MTAPTRQRSRLARRTAVGAPIFLLLAVAFVAFALWRAAHIVNPLLGNWAVQTVNDESEGAYRLELSAVRLNWLKRHVHVDSIRLTTNGAVNAARARPLNDLTIALFNCTISGVHLMTLARGAGFVANSLGCRDGNVAISVPRRTRHRTTAQSRPLLVRVRRLKLPKSLPRLKISQITFPGLGFDFRLKHARRGETRLELERLGWRMTDFAIDPKDSSAAGRPLFSKNIELLAENVVMHPDSMTAVRLGVLTTNVSDSLIMVQGLVYEPSLSSSERARLHPEKSTYVRITAARAQAQGFDFGALALGEGTIARRIELDAFRVEVTTTKRPSSGRAPRVRRSPQAWLVDLEQTLSVDSVVLRDGEAVYRENRPDHAHPGVITFAHLQATAVNFHHWDGRHTDRDAMTLTTTSYLQKTGRFDLQFTVPLDAPRFDMTFRGTLGAMPVTAFNEFVAEAFPWRIDKGEVKTITFSATVRNGVAAGTITPIYRDLKVEVTGSGAKGILGAGGVVGSAARGIASLAANVAKVNTNNPDDPDHPTEPPQTGVIHTLFTHRESLPGFLWFCIRDGLLPILKK